jgi:hypothetical protein
MSDETCSNTTKNNAGKMPGGITGKGFVKGDPRINRKGRPRTFDQLRRLAISILSEPAKGADGQPIVIDGHIATNVEIILRTAMRSPRFAQLLLEVAYGKVPDRVEVSGRDGAPLKVQAYDYYAAASAIAARPDGDSSESSAD